MRVKPIKSLQGVLRIPGDKSVSHRAIMFSSLSNGVCHISNLGMGRDNKSTIGIFKQLGVKIQGKGQNYTVNGVGLHGLKEAGNLLNAGNSGTTIRILSGLLAAQPFYSVMTGDRYLRKRPMKRVIEPLSRMGAVILGRNNNANPPLTIMGGKRLTGVEHHMSVASAQVKSALIMAGMYADGITSITEPTISRDHTERLMQYLGLPIQRNGQTVTVSRVEKIPAFDIDVCGDISSAAFFMVAASLLKRSRVTLKGVGVNPTRTGIIDVLQAMGADIAIENSRDVCGEPVGDIVIKGVSRLKATTVKGDIIPRLIDEIPVIAVAAAFTDGTTVIDDAGELRVKESDRIKAMVNELKSVGVAVEELENGMTIKGGGVHRFAKIKTYGDHRIAMAMYIFGICSKAGLALEETDSISVSFPGFFAAVKGLVRD